MMSYPESLSLSRNISISPLTTWRVGGVSEFYAEPNMADLTQVLAWARQAGVSVYIIGRGSNILVSDSGIKGVVLNTRVNLKECFIDDDFVYAEAGASLPMLARLMASKGYAGFEFLVGIPGTVGGGVAMNAGTYAYMRREISDILHSVDVIDEMGHILTVTPDQLGFGYRCSLINEHRWVVCAARFKLSERDDPTVLQARTVAHLNERRRKQPLNKLTAGSVFKNPVGNKSAGALIEAAGLKGVSLGGARVSPKHANWIENWNSASAADILGLIEKIQAQVSKVFSVDLETEIIYIR